MNIRLNFTMWKNSQLTEHLQDANRNLFSVQKSNHLIRRSETQKTYKAPHKKSHTYSFVKFFPGWGIFFFPDFSLNYLKIFWVQAALLLNFCSTENMEESGNLRPHWKRPSTTYPAPVAGLAYLLYASTTEVTGCSLKISSWLEDWVGSGE